MIAHAATKSKTPLDPSRFLDSDDVMKLLKVSRTTLFELTKRKINPIPTVKIGASRRFPNDEVRVWMKNPGL